MNVSLKGNDLTIHANARCPQVGVLSLILWFLVVDSLLENRKSLNLFCIGYADDDVIMVRVKVIKNICNIITEGLMCAERWCNTEVSLLIHRQLQ